MFDRSVPQFLQAELEKMGFEVAKDGEITVALAGSSQNQVSPFSITLVSDRNLTSSPGRRNATACG